MVKCRRMKRLQFMSENWTYSWQWKSSGIRQQFYRSEIFATNTDTLMNGSTVKNHISLEMVFEYSDNTEIFVPIVVLGLSPSSSSSSHHSTSMTTLRQKIDHSKSSSSSSTSTLTTPSKEIDHSDHPPAIVSSESVDRQVRGDPYSFETSEELLNKPTKIPKPNKNESRTGTGRPI